jgi:hypothetical protein
MCRRVFRYSTVIGTSRIRIHFDDENFLSGSSKLIWNRIQNTERKSRGKRQKAKGKINAKWGKFLGKKCFGLSLDSQDIKRTRRS